MSELKPASFWPKKRDTVLILLRGLQKWCPVKESQEHGSSFGIFR